MQGQLSSAPSSHQPIDESAGEPRGRENLPGQADLREIPAKRAEARQQRHCRQGDAATEDIIRRGADARYLADDDNEQSRYDRRNRGQADEPLEQADEIAGARQILLAALHREARTLDPEPDE